MDLTALELGLRNRQLLQVKCFLKIQVETFRYFLTEELPHLKSPEERAASLDKFFIHDWQNVINKIVSVAVVNKNGDYVSMMLAVSLFRAIIQSCNQLLLIIASIHDSDLDELLLSPKVVSLEEIGKPYVMLSRSSSSASSYDSQLKFDSSTIKEKIFSILQRQIRSIKCHLEQIVNVNVGSIDLESIVDLSISNDVSKDEDNNIPSMLGDTNREYVHQNINLTVNNIFDKLSADVDATFRQTIGNTIDKIPILQAAAKKLSHSSFEPNAGIAIHLWDYVIQAVVDFVSSQLNDAEEITLDLIDRMCVTLSQTGLSSLYLLFFIYFQTCDAKLRQKLLQVFLIRFSTVAQLDAAFEHEMRRNNDEHCELFNRKILNEAMSFSQYIPIASIIDLYSFCYRPKLNESIEMSIEWVLSAKQYQFALVKAFVLPALDEISIHPDLFANWQRLNEQIYGELWHRELREHFIAVPNFVSLIDAEILWQYWIDNNRAQLVVDWIETSSVSLPFCDAITVSDDFATCERMVTYLREKASHYFLQHATQALCRFPKFFANHELNQLDAQLFSVQSMLGYVGQFTSVKLSDDDNQLNLLHCFDLCDEKSSPSSPSLSAQDRPFRLRTSLLIEYCLEHELYELLFLIFNRYRSKVEPVILELLQSNHTLASNAKHSAVLRLLLHFNVDNRLLENVDDEMIFNKGVLTVDYLASSVPANSAAPNDAEALVSIVHHLIANRQDIDLALLLLSFSKKVTFDQLAQYISQCDHVPNVAATFYKLLSSKYALMYKAFEEAHLEQSLSSPLSSLTPPPLMSSTPENRTSNLESLKSSGEHLAGDSPVNLPSTAPIDFYVLLQQAIPYVNIDRFFKWQIKRRVQLQKLRQNSPLNDSDDSPEFAARIRHTSVSGENSELPNFSQNRLSELYGLKAELTSSYYLKNSRLLESFFKCFHLKSTKSARMRDQSINRKLASKAIRKAAIIAYGSIRQNSVFACCLMFQSLIRNCLSPSKNAETGGKPKISSKDANDSKNVPHSPIGNDLSVELEKSRLHLSLGKLIIEFVPEALAIHSAQQQQSMLAALLRKSHFNADRTSSQKLLDFAVEAIERKHSGGGGNTVGTGANNNFRNSILNYRLHSLIFSDQVTDEVTASDEPPTTSSSHHQTGATSITAKESSLLMECFDWKPLLNFADFYGLKKPFNFLRKCAREDNWLVFSIFAQMYAITKDDIQGLLRQGIFNNQCIGEHLAKAFQSSARLGAGSHPHPHHPPPSVADTQLRKLKQAPTSSRNDLYSRLFKGRMTSYSSAEQEAAARAISNNLQRQQQPADAIESEMLSISSSPETFSLASTWMMSTRLSDETGNPSPLILYEHMLRPDSACKDFLQLVLEIFQNCVVFGARTNSGNYSLENTFRNTLLYASVSLSNPVLALLACSLDRPPLTPVIEIKSSIDSIHARTTDWTDRLSSANNGNSLLKFTSFMCWLLSSVRHDSKQQFIDSYVYADDGQAKKTDMIACYLDWSSERSLRLIDVLTRRDARVFVKLHEGFRIFALEIPILEKFLQFLIQFFIEKDYYQEDNLLLEVKSLLQTYNEDEFLLSKGIPSSEYESFATEETEESVLNKDSLRIFYSKNWIENCALILLTNSLILSQQFELGILLSHYNFVRLQDSFSPNFLRIPDIRNLYFFSKCLDKLPNFTLPIADLLRHGPALSNNGENCDYTQYVSIFRKLIFDLQEAGNFEEARNIINLLPQANVNEFIINEWMLKAKKVKNSDPTEANFSTDPRESDDAVLEQIDLAFWENCWSQVTKLDPSMHSAFKVMERFVQHLQPNQMLIKCFVLLKCMLAIESILRDFIETNRDHATDDENAVEQETTLFGELTSTANLGLVQDYFQFEHSLWSSVVECEYLVTHKLATNRSAEHSNDSFVDIDLDRSSASADVSNYADNSYDDDHKTTIATAWQLIWRDIIGFIKSSSFVPRIIPKLSLKHTYFYKNLNARRNKQRNVTLEKAKLQALNQVIQKLLDSLCLQKAKEVSALFAYNHDDFEIIQACDNAAAGLLQSVTDAPFSVQFKIQNLESSGAVKLSTTFSRFLLQNLTEQQKQTILLIETFTNFATIGKKSCDMILLNYRIACILQISYADLMSKHYTSLDVFWLLLSSTHSSEYGASSSGGGNSNAMSSYLDVTRSQIESGNDHEFDHDQNINSLDNSGGIRHRSPWSSSLSWSSSSLPISHYIEAIACAKVLIKIVGEQDEMLCSDEKVAQQLATFTHRNVQRLVDQQFGDSDNCPASSSSSSAVTEIELDKHQIAFASARFLVLIKLLQQPSILGHSLIDICKRQKSQFDTIRTNFAAAATNAVSESHSDLSDYQHMLAKRKHYVSLVELYIRAHECFTAQCDVHGIALVLRRTRLLITQELQSERYFHLILRLLTGIGRYSEMTYCFDLFRECDRFELILSKRVQRTPQLRIALLNYLKTTDKIDELLPLVAIRFFLYRETADYHRTRAERLHGEICASHSSYVCATSSTQYPPPISSATRFTSSPVQSVSSGFKRISSSRDFDTVSHSPSSFTVSATATSHINALSGIRDNLASMMFEYQEAESNYTKASSHTNADLCSRKAQLVALQIAYLNRASTSGTDSLSANQSPTIPVQTPWIIQMDSNQVRDFICQCNCFHEALIVSKANAETAIDWTDPFFRHVIINQNMTYLADFVDSFPISIALLKNLVKRFEQLCSAFKHQSKSSVKEPYNVSGHLLSQQPLSNSPFSASFNHLLGQIRSESQLQKAHRLLEQLLERTLCPPNDPQSCPPEMAKLPLTVCNIKDRYKLAAQFDSPQIMQRLLEVDAENAAYLLDLKHLRKL